MDETKYENIVKDVIQALIDNKCNIQEAMYVLNIARTKVEKTLVNPVN